MGEVWAGKFKVQSSKFIPIAIGTKFKVLNAGNGKSPGVVPKASAMGIPSEPLGEDGSQTAAAPRNICRNGNKPLWIKVQPALSADRRTETLNRNMEYRIMNVESENNIPVLRTSGYNSDSNATKITGALHLGFQHTGIAISETAAAPQNTLFGIQWNCRTSNGETAAAPQNILTCNQWIWNEKPAAAPRNICSNECNTFGMKVQRTET